MNFENCLHMDPHLLVGLLNTAIRNEHGTIEELCAVHELQHEALILKLSEAGYDYMPKQQQFR